MSKLNFDQKTIRALLQDEDADFLIPDYQRPYAWSDDECSTLWDDLFSFAFPNNASDQFDKNNDYLDPSSPSRMTTGSRRSSMGNSGSRPSCSC